MQNNYIMLTINQLRQIMALSANRSLEYNQIIVNENGGARVEFYLNEQAAENGDNPKEIFKLKSAQDYGEMMEARDNVKYLIDHPQASIDFHGLGYWAQQLEKAQKQLLY